MKNIPLTKPAFAFQPLGPVDELFDCRHCGYYPVDRVSDKCPRCCPPQQLDLPFPHKAKA